MKVALCQILSGTDKAENIKTAVEAVRVSLSSRCHVNLAGLQLANAPLPLSLLFPSDCCFQWCTPSGAAGDVALPIQQRQVRLPLPAAL